MQKRKLERTKPKNRSNRFTKCVIAAGLAVVLTAGISRCGKSGESTGQIRDPVTAGLELPKKPIYQTRAKWNKEQETKFRDSFFKWLFTIRMPDSLPVNDPHDSYSCIMDMEIARMDARAQGMFFDSDTYLSEHGCVSTQKFLSWIIANPTPEAIDALRLLVEGTQKGFDVNEIIHDGMSVPDVTGITREFMYRCEDSLKIGRIYSGASPLMTAIDLAASGNSDAWLIVRDNLDTFEENETRDYFKNRPVGDDQDKRRRAVAVSVLQSNVDLRFGDKSELVWHCPQEEYCGDETMMIKKSDEMHDIERDLGRGGYDGWARLGDEDASAEWTNVIRTGDMDMFCSPLSPKIRAYLGMKP
ncbi:MAG: hypothetical protein Q7S22_03265 [Candidatus Micrarchaeota archaeon]|nr:hypothetical protein [Candidatus Micrarchaeota archaeon]